MTIRALMIASGLLGACTVVEPDQVEFDKVVGAAYGLDPCDCRIEGGQMHLLCTSDGDIDSVALDVPPTPDVDVTTQLKVTLSNVAVLVVGTQPVTGRFSLGDAVLAPGDTFPLRAVSNMHFAWPQQDVCGAQSGCDAGKVHLHSGRLEGGHGGCVDLGF
ncbi:MAG: hypothetical protein K8W52_17105 [Deltaproteobacteria bacterium]|nr:hypothetical protein [Deltaproteobacteria bacterium]